MARNFKANHRIYHGKAIFDMTKVISKLSGQGLIDPSEGKCGLEHVSPSPEFFREREQKCGE
jgi:hypothetical protein